PSLPTIRQNSKSYFSFHHFPHILITTILPSTRSFSSAYLFLILMEDYQRRCICGVEVILLILWA
ncbi:hypothetical protein LINPERPRIM_LOCUS7229, partial [Linum perenne]